MQGLMGVFGHISAFDKEHGRVLLSPGAGSDRGSTRPEEIWVFDLEGKVLEGSGCFPLEWPIHTAIHSARSDALAVAHLHSPYATLFAVNKREFRPVTLAGTMFDAVP